MGSEAGQTPSQERELNLRYLQAELGRMDVLIRREVRRWQLAGQDPADAFRGLAISAQTAANLSSRAFGSSWGQGVQLPAEEEAAFECDSLRYKDQVETIFSQAQSQKIELRLQQLAQIFQLDSFECDAFLLTMAPALDLRYERLYGFLRDNVTLKTASVNLILNLLCGGGEGRLTRLACFRPEAPLFRNHILVRDGEKNDGPNHLLSQSLHVDPSIVAWLLGDYHPSAEAAPFTQLISSGEDETDTLLSAPLEQQADFSSFEPSAGQSPLLAFYGADQAGQQAAARRVAVRLGRPLLTVDLAQALVAGMHPVDAVSLALRDARLTGATPFFCNWDVCLVSERAGSEGEKGGAKSGGAPIVQVLTEVCAYPGLAITSSQNVWHAAGVQREKPIQWIEFSLPSYQARLALWQHFLGQPAAGEKDDFNLSALAGQFLLTGSQIRDAVATARDLAAQRGRLLGATELFSAARLHSNSTLGGLARKIEPRYTWKDIILPEDQLTQLREVVSTVRSRPLVLEEWGVGRKLVPSSGIPILFSGPPGTGKTMAAEVIANELGLDLYKIELSGVVSKYIGETEKNLERIFDEAEQSNAILFFDEADAIFGKRSEVKDAHDRYANIETSYLLQRMELYGGVTILATNLRANLDQAFTRRLQFLIDFPFPDENDRQRIWQALFPASVPHDLAIDFGLLARSYKLAGGNIRNIIVSAAYTAAADGRTVNLDHLLHGVRREMQKMGRLIDDKSKKS